MTDWQPIETAPMDGPILVYFANRVWHDMNGEVVSFGGIRDHVERTETAWCHNGVICESGTAHDLFEDWREPDNTPTHWMPLPDPPSSPE